MPNTPEGRRALRSVLDSLPQGVVMFDGDKKLVLVNSTYISMYNLNEDVVKSGILLHDLITHRKKCGLFRGNVRKYCAYIVNLVKLGQTSTVHIETPDGRTIRVINAPLASGGWIVTHEDVSSHKKAEDQIAFMANHDLLTHLPNRSMFMGQLEQTIRLNPRRKIIAVMFLDLDNFKSINDTLGHHAGDELLRVVSSRIRSCLRVSDLVARFGGDEFVVAVPYLDSPSEVASLATRLRDAIIEPCNLGEHQVVVDTSVGIALCPGDGDDASQLLKSADMALYSAKGSGRGTYRFFESAMDTRMAERRILELEIRKAFVNGEFEVQYQPLINLERNEISSCEALLRWKHPEKGFIAPDVFIPVAEEIGLIGRIGEWVIRTACQEASKWPGDISVAVNISPVQFRSQNLLQIIIQALAVSGLDPSRLEIEITEATLMEQTDEIVAILNSMRALGVRVAMDDFGTGYSSLSYLQKFPFNKIKIDQSFIRGLGTSEESSAIVKAVAGLADSFNMATTAEGVETESQRAIVSALGCTEMQGFLFSAARPAMEIREMIAGQIGDRRIA